MWYHSTNNLESIKENGFRINRSQLENRYGQGIYFTDNKEYSIKFGKDTIELNSINVDKIYTYEEWKEVEDKILYPQYGFDSNFYIPKYIKSLGYKVVSIERKDGIKELIVYDESILN